VCLLSSKKPESQARAGRSMTASTRKTIKNVAKMCRDIPLVHTAVPLHGRPRKGYSTLQYSVHSRTTNAHQTQPPCGPRMTSVRQALFTPLVKILMMWFWRSECDQPATLTTPISPPHIATPARTPNTWI